MPATGRRMQMGFPPARRSIFALFSHDRVQASLAWLQADFGRRIAEETEKWGKVLRFASRGIIIDGWLVPGRQRPSRARFRRRERLVYR